MNKLNPCVFLWAEAPVRGRPEERSVKDTPKPKAKGKSKASPKLKPTPKPKSKKEAKPKAGPTPAVKKRPAAQQPEANGGEEGEDPPSEPVVIQKKPAGQALYGFCAPLHMCQIWIFFLALGKLKISKIMLYKSTGMFAVKLDNRQVFQALSWCLLMLRSFP